jgi:hypothetical protein
MSRYFSRFPFIEYEGKNVRNITRRSKVIEDLRKDPYVFLPYTIKEGERPEDIAYYYYGTVDDTWLILLANNIFDPYTEWAMNDDDFDQYFINKYSSLSGETGSNVIQWGLDETRDDNIVYYYKEVDRS